MGEIFLGQFSEEGFGGKSRGRLHGEKLPDLIEMMSTPFRADRNHEDKHEEMHLEQWNAVGRLHRLEHSHFAERALIVY